MLSGPLRVVSLAQSSRAPGRKAMPVYEVVFAGMSATLVPVEPSSNSRLRVFSTARIRFWESKVISTGLPGITVCSPHGRSS